MMKCFPSTVSPAQGEFSDIEFSLHRGEVLGVFGLVGSGRTAMARSIFGAEPATSGSIGVDGRSLRMRTPREAVSAGISLVTEDRKRDGLVMTGTICDNVSLASFPRMSRGIFLNRKLQEELVEGKVRELALRPQKIGAYVRTLSGGNQQKVILAKWLLCSTKVLLLDEPTRGVDIGAKVEIYHLINALVEAGVGVLFISSEMIEVLGMSDRILVMREGRLVGDVGREEASEERLLQLAAGVARAASAANVTPGVIATEGRHENDCTIARQDENDFQDPLVRPDLPVDLRGVVPGQLPAPGDVFHLPEPHQHLPADRHERPHQHWHAHRDPHGRYRPVRGLYRGPLRHHGNGAPEADADAACDPRRAGGRAPDRFRKRLLHRPFQASAVHRYAGRPWGSSAGRPTSSRRPRSPPSIPFSVPCWAAGSSAPFPSRRSS